MIEQIINVEDYWKVIVYYNVDYNFFDIIYKQLIHYNINEKTIKSVYNKMYKRYAKGVTISNYRHHVSIVLFNTHKTKEDYVNTIVHEAEHIKQAMLKVYDVEDYGEPPAYTIGFLVMKMYSMFKYLKLEK